MSTVAPLPDLAPHVCPPPVQLVESNGENLETFWHQVQIILLADIINFRFDERQDFFAGGNMFIYFSEEQARKRDFRGPDFFYVKDVSRMPIRKWWAVWEEGGRYPNFILELLSPSTAAVDRTVKKDIYERVFRTPEYFCYDPDTRVLEGWHLDNKLRYQPLKPNDKGRLWSDELECWLGTWEGSYLGLPMTWLRLFDNDGCLLPTRAEAETCRAQTEAARAQAEAARAQAEAARAETEAARREAAEAEVARLQKEVDKLERKAP